MTLLANKSYRFTYIGRYGGSYGYCGGIYQNYWNTTATYIAYQQLSFSMMYLDSPGTTSQVIYQP